MKFQSWLLVLPLFFLSSLARGELTPADLIGQTELLDPRYEAWFNAANGFVYAESQVLKNLIKFSAGGPEKPILQLAEELLFSPEGITLSPSTGESRIGTYLDIEDVADLLVYTIDPAVTPDKIAHVLDKIAPRFKSKTEFKDKSKKLIANLRQPSNLLPPSHILLAFLWKKANSRADLIRYYERLPKPYLSPRGHALLASPVEKQAWVLKQFVKEDYQKWSVEEKALLPQGAEKLLQGLKHKTKEEQAYFIYGYQAFDAILPPFVSYGSAHVPGSGSIYSDCVETSIRNWINAMLYHEGKFVIHKLKALPLHSPELDLFYENVQINPLLLQSPLVHDQWSYILSNRPHLKGKDIYKKTAGEVQYEVVSSIDNVLAVLNDLLFNGTLHGTRTEIWSQIFTALAPEGMEWDVVGGKSLDEISHGDLVFSRDRKPLFRWQISKGHSSIVDISEDIKDWRTLLVKPVMKQAPQERAFLLPLLVQPKNAEKVVSLLGEYRDSEWLSLYSLPLALQDVKSILIPYLTEPHHAPWLPLASRLIKETPQEDWVSQFIIAEALFANQPSGFEPVAYMDAIILNMSKILGASDHSQQKWLSSLVPAYGGPHIVDYMLSKKPVSKESLCPVFEMNWEHPESSKQGSPSDSGIYLAVAMRKQAMMRKLVAIGCDINAPMSLEIDGDKKRVDIRRIEFPTFSAASLSIFQLALELGYDPLQPVESRYRLDTREKISERTFKSQAFSILRTDGNPESSYSFIFGMIDMLPAGFVTSQDLAELEAEISSYPDVFESKARVKHLRELVTKRNAP